MIEAQKVFWILLTTIFGLGLLVDGTRGFRASERTLIIFGVVGFLFGVMSLIRLYTQKQKR